MEEYNSSDDDDYVGLHKAFSVRPLPKDFNPKKTPSNGEEYLHYVMYESSQYSDISIASDLNLAKYPLGGQVEIKPHLPTNSSQTPSSEWEEYHLNNFNKITDFVNSRRMADNPVNVNFPLETPSYSKWLEWMETNRPLLSVVLSLTQEKLHCILRILLKYLTVRKNPVKLHHGEWLYAVCATLQQPLDKSACSDLRDIVREFAFRRNLLPSKNVKELRMLNLIISIVVKCFKQSDLISETG